MGEHAESHFVSTVTGMPITRVESREDGSGETAATDGGILSDVTDPSGWGGAWSGHFLCTGGHDVIAGMTSSQNRSGSGPPGAAQHLFWPFGGVGGAGMASSLANHPVSHSSSAPSMPSATSRCLLDECATLPVTLAKRA